MLTVVITAYNEQRTVAKAIERASEACVHPERIELIVVDACSRDRTAVEAARAIARSRVRARLVQCPSRRGAAANAGAEAASPAAEQILFLHADTVVPFGYDQHVRKTLGDPTVLLGSFQFRVDRSSVSRWPTGLEVVEWFANLRSRLFRLPYGDQGLFLRRQDWAGEWVKAVNE